MFAKVEPEIGERIESKLNELAVVKNGALKVTKTPYGLMEAYGAGY
jgi:hypothetical protein